MYDCINIAHTYLKEKYGVSHKGLTSKSLERLRKASNKKQRKEIENSFTDDNYYHIVNPATEQEDKNIELLMSQYYYGITVKKELYYKLESMGLI